MFKRASFFYNHSNFKCMKTKLFLAALTVFIFVNSHVKSQNADGTSIQVALLLDTSNSMDGLIDQAKTELWSVLNEHAKAQYQNLSTSLEIALYEYGNDKLEVNDGYMRRVVDFSTDLDLISEQLFALKTDGGYEYCGQVIDKSVSDLKWSTSDRDLKIIFIAGNEEFTQGTVDYKMSCKNAKSKGIIVNSIFCGDAEEGIRYFWKDGAQLADGAYLNINQSVTAAYIESPFDEEIMKLGVELNKTYIAYGGEGEERSVRQEAQDSNAAGSSRGVAVNRALSKSSHVYKNSKWDLVDAVDDKTVSIEKLSKDDLPEEMKNMSKEEKEAYIQKKKTERIEIQTKIAELNKKREQYVAEKQIENSENSTLGNAIKQLIRTQAEAKNYTFKD